jgi:hypothetical protein
MEQHPDSPAVDTAPTPPEAGASSEAEPTEPHSLATSDDTNGAPPPNGYDPADYRWVPVRRVPRTDGWTEEKMRRYIETLADTGQVSLAAKAVGMSRESAYKLRRSPTLPSSSATMTTRSLGLRRISASPSALKQ